MPPIDYNMMYSWKVIRELTSSNLIIPTGVVGRFFQKANPAFFTLWKM